MSTTNTPAPVSLGRQGTDGLVTLPPRKKRCLDFVKCHFCRRDKQKCLPSHGRVWPGQKCVRCVSENLECGPPERKGSAKTKLPISAAVLRRRDVPVVSEDNSAILRSENIPFVAEENSAVFRSEDVPVVSGEHQAVLRSEVVPEENPGNETKDIEDLLLLTSYHRVLMMATRELQELIDQMEGLAREDMPNGGWSEINAVKDFHTFVRDMESLIDKRFRDALHAATPKSTPSLALPRLFMQFHEAKKSPLPPSEAYESWHEFYLLMETGDYGAAFVLQLSRSSTQHPHLRRVKLDFGQLLQCLPLFQGSIRRVLGELESESAINVPKVIKDFPLFIPKSIIKDDYDFDGLDNARFQGDCIGRSLLHIAFDHGTCIEEWRFPRFLSGHQDILGRTQLHVAALKGKSHAGFCWKLRGLDPNKILPSGMTALHLAAIIGQLETFEAMFRNHCTNWDARDIWGRSAAHYLSARNKALVLGLALDYGPTEFFELLLQPGVDFNQPDHFGQTPFSRATSRKRVDVMRLLGSFESVNVNTTDLEGDTPLRQAVQKDFKEGIAYLVKRDDVDVNLANGFGRTPLISAAYCGRFHVAQILANHPNIDLNLRDLYNRTALDHAKEQGSKKIVNMLQSEKRMSKTEWLEWAERDFEMLSTDTDTEGDSEPWFH